MMPSASMTPASSAGVRPRHVVPPPRHVVLWSPRHHVPTWIDTYSLTLAGIPAQVAPLPSGPRQTSPRAFSMAAFVHTLTNSSSAAEADGMSQPHGPDIGLPPVALRAPVALDDSCRTPSAPRPTRPRQVTPVRAREAEPNGDPNAMTSPNLTPNPASAPPVVLSADVVRTPRARVVASIMAKAGGEVAAESPRINRLRLVSATECAPSSDCPATTSQGLQRPRSVAALTCYALAPTYRQTHARITPERGPASARACHWCGRRAAEWACLCEHSAVITGTNASGRPVTFDPDPAGYVPACRRCHRSHDAARTAARRSPLVLTAKPAQPKPRRVARESIPEPEALFATDPTDSTAWSIQ